MNEWMNEWMNECVYLSLKHNFYNEIQLDSTQSCIADEKLFLIQMIQISLERFTHSYQT